MHTAAGATLGGHCPSFCHQESGIVRRQIEHVAHTPPRQIDAIDAFGEFAREADAHQSKAKQ